jgi:hypothetical protein
MFFIFWGTKVRKDCLGAVADWCPSCQAVQAFTVTNYFHVGHIYYISLGKGRHVGTVRCCWECGWEGMCEEENYHDFLPIKEAEDLSDEELIRLTNPLLTEQLETGQTVQDFNDLRPR